MNDDLIVRISVNCSTFLSLWMALTDFNRKGTTRSEEICSGYFSESSTTMNWEEMNQPNRTDLQGVTNSCLFQKIYCFHEWLKDFKLMVQTK